MSPIFKIYARAVAACCRPHSAAQLARCWLQAPCPSLTRADCEAYAASARGHVAVPRGLRHLDLGRNPMLLDERSLVSERPRETAHCVCALPAAELP